MLMKIKTIESKINMESINDRLQKVIENMFAGKQVNMANTMNVSRAEINRLVHGNGITMVWISRLSEHCPDLDLHWLITGQGQMHYERISLNEELNEIKRGLQILIGQVEHS